MYGGIFRQNGDAALALQIAGVHHAVRHDLIFAVHAALLEHLIDQRRFAVVNVRNDGDVPNFILGHTKAPFCARNISQSVILTQSYPIYNRFSRKKAYFLHPRCAQTGTLRHRMGGRRDHDDKFH